jgi:serine/threonine-protein kinase
MAAGTVGDVSVTRPSISLPERYRVIRHIASGGMAGVWEAHDEVLDRKVAVKVLAQHLNEDDRARRRFQREARAAAGMSSHPHVVTIYDVGETDDRSFIVMELKLAGSLAERVAAGRQPREKVLQWLADAASALDAAHDAGIVHRDIKPANLLLDEHDRLAIADFGIARIAFDDQLTQTGLVLGTASYLAPEQAMGEQATPASDRYALAVVAFELLTGGKPFPHENFAAQARAHVDDPPPDASEVDRSIPPAAADALKRGMAKDPAERWPTAAAFVEGLATALDGAAGPPTEPTRRMSPMAAGVPPAATGRRAPPPSPPRRPAGAAAGPHPHRRNVPVLAALVGLLFGAIALAAVLSGGGDQQQAASRPPASERKAPESTPTAEATPEQTQTPEPTPEAPQPDEAAASGLNSQGFGLMNAGRYDEAVGPLRQAYDACKGSSALDPCGYAIYNLGRSLRLAGSPDEAVPVLEERLQRFPDNQPGTVEEELALARAGDTSDGRGRGKGWKKGDHNGNRDEDD